MALAASAIFLVLFAAAVFSTGAYFRERNARLQAVAAESAREAARKTAAAETIRATEVARFVMQFFDAVIPDLEQGGHRGAIKQLLVTADHFAGQLTNAPTAEVELRRRIADSYSTAVHEYDQALVQNQKFERVSVALGDPGRNFARFARAAQEVVRMWDSTDTNAATKLLQVTAVALEQNPPDRPTALFGLSEAAGFNWAEGNLAQSKQFALRTLEIAREVPGYNAARILASEVLLMLANRRNAVGEQEAAGNQMLSAILRYQTGDEIQDRKMVQDFVRTLWEYDPTLLPAKSLEVGIGQLPSGNQLLRTYLQGLHGISIARGGNWQGGLSLLTRSVTNGAACNVGLWHAAVQLAALVGDDDLRRSLSVVGLARFASGADGQMSEALVEPLLIRPPEAAFLPTLRELVDRVLLGTSWIQVPCYFSRALLDFHTGRYDEAADSIERYLREAGVVSKNGADPLLARGWFARASIEMRRGRVAEARDSYRRGLKLHSVALQAPGTPYTGDLWVDACTAELLRREAAKLLDEATPTSP